MERTRASRPITGSTPASLVKQNPAPQPAATSYRQPAGPSRRHRAGPPCPQLQGLSDGGGRRSGGDPHSEECAVIDKSRGLAFRSAGRPRRRAQSGVGAAAAAVDPQGLRSLSPKREWTQSSPVAGTRAGTTVCRIVQLHMCRAARPLRRRRLDCRAWKLRPRRLQCRQRDRATRRGSRVKAIARMVVANELSGPRP